MPTAADESADAAAADLLYEAYSNLLLERTRDTKLYRLLFEELIGYGFRRNLFGMKPLGLSLSFLCTGLQTASLVHAFRMGHELDITKAVFLTLDLFLLSCWLFMITPSWVKRAADSYADRLLAASEHLPINATKGRPGTKNRETPKAAMGGRPSTLKEGPAPSGGSEA